MRHSLTVNLIIINRYRVVNPMGSTIIPPIYCTPTIGYGKRKLKQPLPYIVMHAVAIVMVLITRYIFMFMFSFECKDLEKEGTGHVYVVVGIRPQNRCVLLLLAIITED